MAYYCYYFVFLMDLKKPNSSNWFSYKPTTKDPELSLLAIKVMQNEHKRLEIGRQKIQDGIRRKRESREAL